MVSHVHVKGEEHVLVFNGDISWTRRKLMKLRQLAYNLIQHRIGDGKDTWMCLDIWHPCGPLLQQFGTRVVYDAGSL